MKTKDAKIRVITISNDEETKEKLDSASKKKIEEWQSKHKDKIAKLSKPTDITDDNLTTVIQDIHDKLNELISSVNTDDSKAVPATTEGKDSDLKIIDDQGDGVVKIGIKTGGSWYTVQTTEE